MGAVFAWVFRWALVCAGLSVGFLIDAVNCVLLGHEDWWMPAGLAMMFALETRNKWSD